MSANTNNWLPPVQFHFSVVFKLPSGDTAASFRSVSGIDQTLALQQQAQQGDNDLTWKSQHKLLYNIFTFFFSRKLQRYQISCV